jgi:hypothetical protein
VRLIARLQRYLERRNQERAARRALEDAKQVAGAKACRHFEASRGVQAMGFHVLAAGPAEIVVRVMYFTDHIPPDRAWYAISREGDGPPRELTWENVAALEPGPWR